MARPPAQDQSTATDTVPLQTDRLARLTTPLGPHALNVTLFRGEEALSELFEYAIEVIGQQVLVDFDAIVGQPCHLALRTKTGHDRHFHGILTEARWLGVRNDFYAYELTLRPWLWLLSRVSDCRIFHNKTVKDIVEEVFRDRGFTDFKMKLTENYPSREYCVQYRETDLDFVCRLLEEEGIYYYFEHSGSQHMLNLVDSKTGHTGISGLPAVVFPRTDFERTDKETIVELMAGRRFQTGKIALNDYDPMKPGAKMESDFSNDPNHTMGTLEAYDYPGRYTETAEGDRLAKVRLQARQALDDRRAALGDAASLFPGGTFNLTGHPEASQNIEYLTVRCSHRFEGQEYRTSGYEAPEAYTASYELQPNEKPFRAPFTTPWPTVQGPQTAKVVGQKGEEIDVDKYGRILVQFYWDRRKDHSCRVRVAQTWSGKTWGTIFIPRIGQEVVIEHLEGNPDRPLCTGTVYNADMTVPYELPAEKTVAGWKSNSSKGGNGYNELVFEDKADSELIRMHAQKDHEVTVLNTETWTIAEEFEGSGDSRTTTIKKGDDTLKVEDGNRTVEIKKDLTTKVEGDETRKVTGKQDIHVTGAITVESPSSIEFKCGSSTIKMTPSSIELKVAQTKVAMSPTELKQESLTVAVKGQATTTVEGSAMVTVKGGLVKIN